MNRFLVSLAGPDRDSPSSARSNRPATSKSPPTSSSQRQLGSNSYGDRGYSAQSSQPRRAGNSPSGNSYGMSATASPSGPSSSSRSKSPACLIAVMGATGSGKSTFVNLVTDSNLRVGAGLTSCTDNVEISKECNINGQSVVLIDTPGFDDTNLSDTEVLTRIALFLSTTYEGGTLLNGIVFIHRISDQRMGGISCRNFYMFRKLCGDNALKNVVIVTNMWGLVDPDLGRSREMELASNPKFFKPALDKGAIMIAHDDTYHSAVDILEPLLERGRSKKPLQIQKELVDEHKKITETAAGAELAKELAELSEKHRQELKEVQDDMRRAMQRKDEETRRELEEVRSDLLGKVKKVEEERVHLQSEYAKEKVQMAQRMDELRSAVDKESSARAMAEKRMLDIEQDNVRMRSDAEADNARLRQQIADLQSSGGGGGGGGDGAGSLLAVVALVGLGLLPALGF